MNDYQTFIEKTIKEAGAFVLDRFGKDGVLRTKSSETDFVTEADLKSSQMIISAIQSAYPDHGIISEEEDEEYQNGAEFVWTIDPIDGTNNFATHTPIFGVMMALMQNKTVIESGIYLPITNELFTATKGKGAFLNGQPIQCSQKENWRDTLALCNAHLTPEKQHIREVLNKASKADPLWLYAYGCAAMSGALLASGRRDWILSKGGKIWDRLPVCLLASEAGCKITNFDGEPWSIDDNELLAANPVLHEKLIELINS